MYRLGDHMGNAMRAAIASNPVRSILDAANPKDYSSQDVKFIQRMIPHHQAALKMTSELGDGSENPEVKALAKDIVKAQSSEIKQMEKWLKDRGLSPTAGGADKMDM